jgi:hypothetical protein
VARANGNTTSVMSRKGRGPYRRCKVEEQRRVIPQLQYSGKAEGRTVGAMSGNRTAAVDLRGSDPGACQTSIVV